MGINTCLYIPDLIDDFFCIDTPLSGYNTKTGISYILRIVEKKA